MEKHYGNYLGLCVNNDDPEKRGRVQVFIPHIMPALYENWNEAGEDIKLICVGNNIPDSLPDNVLEKLKLTLPWAESASPIMGTSAPGSLVGAPSYSQTPGENTFNQSPVPDAAGYAGAAAGGSLGPGATGDTNQDALIAKAIANKNLYEPGGTNLSFAGSQSRCGIGSRRIAGALLGSRYFSQGLGAGGSSQASSTSLGRGNSYFQKSGFYSSPTAASSSYMNDSSQWRIGDVVSCAGGNKNGDGHIQTYVGNGKWVSDFPQGSKILQSPKYSNYTLHRLNDKGLAQLQSAGTVNNFATSASGTTGEAAAGSGYETPSTSGQLAAATPHQSENPIGSTTEDPSRYGNVADPNVQAAGETGATGSIAAGTMPSTFGASDGVKALLAAIGTGESGFSVTEANKNTYNQVSNNANVRRGVNSGMSAAAAQAAYGDYGFFQNNDATEGSKVYNYLKGQGYSDSQASYYRAAITNGQGKGSFSLQDQSQAMVHYLNAQYPGAVAKLNSLNPNDPNFASQVKSIAYGAGMNGKWFGLDEGLAAGAANPNSDAFAKVSGTQLVNAENNGAAPADASSLAAAGGQMVQNKDPHGTTAVMDLNNMSAGMFSYPAAGALLWCFFREGNPLYPVYFAASYSQGEWQSAYRYNVASPAQDGVGYKPAADPEKPTTSVGGTWNIGKVGAISWNDETDPNDPKNNQKSLMIAGHDGSNIFFNEGYHQFFSKFDRRDQVEGDRWETTLGQKEEWIQGDSNLVVMGDMFVKIGNVGPEAVEAVEKIQSLIKESMQPLTEGRDCGGSGGGGSGGNFTKQAQQKSTIKSPDSSAFDIAKTPIGGPLSNRTNNITTPNLPGIPQAVPAPNPSSPANVNATRININPAAPTVAPGQSSGKQSFKVVGGSGWPTGNLKVTPI